MKIGITGQNGFIGWHLSQSIKYFYPNRFQLIPFERSFFEDKTELISFVRQCAIIIHLAGVNRASSEQRVYEENYKLGLVLKEALEIANFKGHLLFASSSQEKGSSLYGKSKKDSRLLLEACISNQGGTFTGLIIPNVFGPFCRPNYNSFVATFCNKLLKSEQINIIKDREVPLIYVCTLVDRILNLIEGKEKGLQEIPHDKLMRVSDVLKLLKLYKTSYIENNTIPSFNSSFELKLFNTFRSYINIEDRYPVSLVKHSDNRGFFSEIIRCEAGGQFSYSLTLPEIVRGNHFHTRKIERFSVVQGKALIQLRKIGSNTTHDFRLNGDSPSFVDMPIWYTHKITNIGEEPLITLFWINEPYDENDSDTYFEIV